MLKRPIIESLESRTLFAAAAVDPTLVASYQFDEGSGSIASDATGHGNTGALINSPAWTTGENGTALKFSETAQSRVIVHNAADLEISGPLTVSAWVDPNADAYQIVVEKGRENTNDGFELGLHANGKIFFRINQADLLTSNFVNSGTKYSLNQWTQIAGTYDGSTLCIYVDGALQGSVIVATAVGTSTGNLAIGAQNNAMDAVSGAVDDVRIYNRALAASEINAVYVSALLEHAMTFGQGQLQKTIAKLGSNTSTFVNTTNSSGAWNTISASDWTSGFLAGSMWQAYQATGNSYWSTEATKWTTPLAGQATSETADLYFRLMTTYLPLYQETGNAAYAQVLLNAAASKETEWNAAVGAFRCDWGTTDSGNPAANFPVLIDQTTDLLLMFWAAQQTGNQTYYNQALEAARTVVAHMMRPDGSTYQFGYFNATSGQFIDGETSQGYSNSSTWSRGQAWAIYSLTAIARITGAAGILNAAQSAANYYIAHLPADGVPYWDFNSPAIPNTYRDSSAAAIAASGLLDLSTLQTNATAAASDLASAEHTLESLALPGYLAEGTKSAGILLHGAQNVPHTPGNDDVSLIFGDYFFLQAINRFDAILG